MLVRRLLLTLLLVLLVQPAWAVYTPIPGLSVWESNLTVQGQVLCDDPDPQVANIASSTSGGPPITINTSTGHSLTNGSTVIIQNHLTNTAANGVWTGTVVDTDTFTIPATGNGVGGATGTTQANVEGYLDTQYDYDRINAFHVAWQYTGNASWLTCSDSVKSWWNPYVTVTTGNARIVPTYGLAGFRSYTSGNLADWQRTGDATSLTIVQQVQLLAYGADSYDLTANSAKNAGLIREEGLGIANIVNAQISGYPHRTKLDDYLEVALGTNGWVDRIVGKTAVTFHDDAQTYPGYTSFMTGLGLRGIIGAFDLTHDLRTIPQLKRLVDYMWTTGWTTTITPNAFFYRYWTGSTPFGAPVGVSVNGSPSWTNPTTDSGLNPLIMPAYAWMYLKTLDTTYRDQHNLAFEAATQQDPNSLAFGNGKLYNQFFLWSYRGIQWYIAAELALNTRARQQPTVTNRPAATNRVAVTNRPAKTAWHVW